MIASEEQQMDELVSTPSTDGIRPIKGTHTQFLLTAVTLLIKCTVYMKCCMHTEYNFGLRSRDTFNTVPMYDFMDMYEALK